MLNRRFTKTLLWLAQFWAAVIAIVFLPVGCKRNSVRDREVMVEPQKHQQKEFKIVDIPSMLIEPQARATYLSEHYWGNFDFADTTYIHLPEITEQAFVDYLSTLSLVDLSTAKLSIHTMLSKAEALDKSGRMYSFFLELYQKYLYDPNSPIRNDEFYISVVKSIISDKSSDETSKERANFEYQMLIKNRVGTQASDFVYTRSDGKKWSLHRLKRDYTIIYFYNPDCQACREVKLLLSESPLINNLLDKTQLDILAVYPDEDLDAWQKHKNTIPLSWINGYDHSQTIRNRVLYDLRAIPSLYLLDKDKIVLLKDVEISTLIEYLSTTYK